MRTGMPKLRWHSYYLGPGPWIMYRAAQCPSVRSLPLTDLGLGGWSAHDHSDVRICLWRSRGRGGNGENAPTICHEAYHQRSSQREPGASRPRQGVPSHMGSFTISFLRQFQTLLWETGNINLGLSSLVIRLSAFSITITYIHYFVYRHSNQLHLL